EVGDGRGEEEEVEDELDHPLAELVERLLRLQVEEPEQVDEQECGEEEDDERNGSRCAPAPRDCECDEEDERENVRQRDVAGDVPVNLLERDAERRREQQEVRDVPRPHSQAPQQIGELLDAGGAAEPLPLLRSELRPGETAVAP